MVPSISSQTSLAQQGVQSAGVSQQASMQSLPLAGPSRVYEAGHKVVMDRKDAAILKEAGLTRLWQQNVVVSGRHYPIETHEFADVAGAYSFFLGGSGGGTPLAEGSMIRSADGSILCWRQNYVLRVHVPASVSVAVVDAVAAQGRSWAETIGETAPVPVMVKHLPPTRLLPGTVRYELGVAGLGRYVDAELLAQFEMRKNVEAAVGDYQGGGRLVLLGYPTAALARQYHERLKQFIQGYPVPVGIKRAGVIVAVASGMDPQTTRQVLERVQYAPSVKWIYKKEDDSTYLRRLAEREASGVMGTVVTAILFTLLFCGITALGGLSVGVARYWANEHYPNRGGRLQRIERIQLHLNRAANTRSRDQP
ncbi:MAG: DUF6599 family protein [Acidobacteriota bacterium]